MVRDEMRYRDHFKNKISLSFVLRGAHERCCSATSLVQSLHDFEALSFITIHISDYLRAILVFFPSLVFDVQPSGRSKGVDRSWTLPSGPLFGSPSGPLFFF